MSTGSEVVKLRGVGVFIPLGAEAVDRTPVRWTGLEALIPSEPWMRDALCSQTDPDMFFPERGEDMESPRAVCAQCTVREDCLIYALVHHEQHGIWGGLSTIQRKRLLARRNARRAADEARARWGL